MATKSKSSNILRKPTLKGAAVLNFAEGKAGAKASKSGLVPEGDTRLTANIRTDLHIKLKVRAAEERTTVGQLIERWIESWR